MCRFECATTLRRCKRRYECPEFFVVGVQLYHVRGICTNKDRLLSKSELCVMRHVQHGNRTRLLTQQKGTRVCQVTKRQRRLRRCHGIVISTRGTRFGGLGKYLSLTMADRLKCLVDKQPGMARGRWRRSRVSICAILPILD